ncbi:hypothetical protein BT69DRAFT_1324834 [Atractiella rhizophila]|nr:hypothetical protein BT69DRAFT_1324834 [Atractiella rhizophila]
MADELDKLATLYSGNFDELPLSQSQAQKPVLHISAKPRRGRGTGGGIGRGRGTIQSGAAVRGRLVGNVEAVGEKRKGRKSGAGVSHQHRVGASGSRSEEEVDQLDSLSNDSRSDEGSLGDEPLRKKMKLDQRVADLKVDEVVTSSNQVSAKVSGRKALDENYDDDRMDIVQTVQPAAPGPLPPTKVHPPPSIQLSSPDLLHSSSHPLPPPPVHPLHNPPPQSKSTSLQGNQNHPHTQSHTNGSGRAQMQISRAPPSPAGTYQLSSTEARVVQLQAALEEARRQSDIVSETLTTATRENEEVVHGLEGKLESVRAMNGVLMRHLAQTRYTFARTREGWIRIGGRLYGVRRRAEGGMGVGERGTEVLEIPPGEEASQEYEGVRAETRELLRYAMGVNREGLERVAMGMERQEEDEDEIVIMGERRPEIFHPLQHQHQERGRPSNPSDDAYPISYPYSHPHPQTTAHRHSLPSLPSLPLPRQLQSQLQSHQQPRYAEPLPAPVPRAYSGHLYDAEYAERVEMWEAQGRSAPVLPPSATGAITEEAYYHQDHRDGDRERDRDRVERRYLPPIQEDRSYRVSARGGEAYPVVESQLHSHSQYPEGSTAALMERRRMSRTQEGYNAADPLPNQAGVSYGYDGRGKERRRSRAGLDGAGRSGRREAYPVEGYTREEYGRAPAAGASVAAGGKQSQRGFIGTNDPDNAPIASTSRRAITHPSQAHLPVHPHPHSPPEEHELSRILPPPHSRHDDRSKRLSLTRAPPNPFDNRDSPAAGHPSPLEVVPIQVGTEIMHTYRRLAHTAETYFPQTGLEVPWYKDYGEHERERERERERGERTRAESWSQRRAREGRGMVERRERMEDMEL